MEHRLKDDIPVQIARRKFLAGIGAAAAATAADRQWFQIAQPSPPVSKTFGSDCAPALRHSAIIFCTRTQGRCNQQAWVRASWGRTVPSGRAFLISSVVGGVNSMM